MDEMSVTKINRLDKVVLNMYKIDGGTKVKKIFKRRIRFN